MDKETIVSSRPDREIRKIVVAQGDYTLVPYEDSPLLRFNFDGNVLIGDSDFFIDKDFELILQQMCCGEKCEATLVYRNSKAFRRFNKALKMIIAIEPVDPAVIDEATVKEITDSKIKLYNNLAYLQLQYHEYDAVLQLCDRKHGWMYKTVLKLDPNDKAFQQQANTLKPILEQRNENYTNVIKKMFN
ncbi:hypothetical protein ACJJTC_012945 [Scirpophaga incertulas]